MRLERVFTHRIVRLLQVILPVFVLALIAVPAWNYYAKRALKTDAPRGGIKLPSGVSVRTDGFTYSTSEGGRTRFVVNAKQSLGFKDEKYVLKDVDVTVFGEKPEDPTRKIRGDNCEYDQTSNDFTCQGNVEMRLDEQTVVRTESVLYNHHDGIVTAPQRSELDKNGTTGHANAFEYGMNSGLLKLNGDVKVQSSNNVTIETGAALFQQKENWTTMSGGVLITSPNGWIRGGKGRATLKAGTYQPQVITVEENVSAESQPKTGRENWKVRANQIVTTLSDSGMAERVQSSGNVDIEKIAGTTSQRLTGSEVDTTFKEGKIDVLEARQNARMSFGPDETLEATKIWTNSAGSVRTADASVLKVGDSTIEGTEFVIENGENEVTFTTARRAKLKKQESGLESSSDQTHARFESGTNMLKELVQSGNFQFRTPQYEGRAKTGRFEQGGTVITLQGSSVVNDSEKRLEAEQIVVNQENNSFVATKNVSTLMKNSTEPVLVKAARAESSADSMVYTGGVQLWRGDVFIRAELLRALGKDRANAKVHAEGGPQAPVQSTIQNVRTTSDTLDYDNAGGVARYLGHVHAKKQDMILQSPDLLVHFRDNNVTDIVASGGVVVDRADQHGIGERAVYDAATDVVTLTGKNVEVRDNERLVKGSKLTMTSKGQNASVEAEKGERTVSRHPIKSPIKK
jgi:LPS export ABC transporter protein LptC/lipopolysaccharide transport protein LptA